MIALLAFVLFVFVNIAASQNTVGCLAENEGLSCVEAKDCPWFQKHLTIYKEYKTDSVEKKNKLTELKSKVCSKGKQRKVCCPEEDTPTTPTTQLTKTASTTTILDSSALPSWVPSAKKQECGGDIYSEFIVGGNFTKLGEHPWAVLVGKNSGTKNRRIKWHCGGTLINRWYIVSAAHCSPSQIKMVRVGEWRVVDTSKPLKRKGIKFSPNQKCCSKSNQKCRRCRNYRLVNGTYDCMDSTNNKFVWPEDSFANNAECSPPHQDIEEDVHLLSTPPTAEPTYSTTTRDVDDMSPRWVPSGRKGECGVDISSKFIIGGNITELGEHPWAVLLGTSSGQQTGKLSQKQIIWKCGGTLINRWYVVSAAHCSPSQIKMVRVGEWKLVDTSKPNRKEGIKFSKRCRRCRRFRLVNGTYDCMDSTNNQFIWPEDTSAHHAVCAPPHQDIEVDRVMKHPDYRRLQSGLVVNDILLIKLQHPVQLSDYAQPACLPIGDSIPLLEHLDERDPSREAVVVGWGKTYKDDFNETTSVASAFQQKLSLNLIKNKDCSAIWSEKYKVDLTGEIRQKNHICAGGKRGEDSCKGDSGGPLLFRESDEDPTYFLGVVSTGTTICGIGVPAIFSRVTSVVQWIVNNIN